MITQEEIIIPVPPEVAEAYRNATEGEREQIKLKIAAIMQIQLANRRQETEDRLGKIMDEIGQRAIERGLTEEILESILKDEQ